MVGACVARKEKRGRGKPVQVDENRLHVVTKEKEPPNIVSNAQKQPAVVNACTPAFGSFPLSYNT
jgi:hypothetical protein